MAAGLHIRLSALCLMISGLAIGAAMGQGREDTGERPLAIVAAIEGAIGPSTTRHVTNAIKTAKEREADVLVLRLDTPGGLATSMREIISEILSSNIPVAGFVAPPGAHAASAGTYILYATSVAAMAPGTNLGAATPVQIGGGLPKLPGSDDQTEEDGEKPQKQNTDPKSAKAVNDAAALIRSLAEMHGRNVEWAEKAVREAASLTAAEALEIKVIDLVAEDIPMLLNAIDGREVTANGKKVTLKTRDATTEVFEPGTLTRLLAILSNPNVALVLMMIGIYGLIFEFANPGSIGPGVIGIICLVLGLYALNQLPLDYTGLALVGLGIAFMVAEAVTPTFGVLGVGGLTSFVIGAAILVDTDIPAYQVSWWVIAAMGALSAAVLIVLIGYLWRAQKKGFVDNVSQLVGMDAEVLDWSGGEGHVRAEGERWHARAGREFRTGETVRVAKLDGLTLIVDPITQDNAASATTSPKRQGA
ncbi:nodulation protein NfeD [Rhizobiales bacterium]|uniref:NfeD family protein n=1 Tax=Hongsoonwoonella zoysiae TaxID=2821844 RepID=UPI001561A60E|nr:nodulation protein NfeD [Hongsoonwoonella zoysiae]NRG17536.1 nodulation protein NfeD [Hongsoonwoonella zoysiae]